MLHNFFSRWMEKEWKWEGNLAKPLKDFAMKMDAWNKDTLEISLGGKSAIC